MSEEMNDNVKHYSKLKVAELRKELKARGLNAAGNKTELLERLTGATGGLPGADVSGIDTDVDAEDILGHDDEDDVDSAGDEMAGDEEDAVLGHEEEEEVLTSGAGALPDVVGAAATPAGAEDGRTTRKQDATPSSAGPHRIVLKRRPSAPPDTAGVSSESGADTSSAGGGVSTTTAADERPGTKRIRITAFSTAERMEMRKQKFGASASDEAKKEIRAVRFGIAPKTPDSDVLKKRAERFGSTPDTAPSSDLLKKRAERFGSSVSSGLTKVETEDKLQKRQERFGGAAAAQETAGTAATTTAKIRAEELTAAERKRLRTLRFQNE